MLKGLYGLVESSSTWYDHLTSFLVKQGFAICEFDKCVLKKGGVTLVIYVDDLMFTGPEEEANEACDLVEAEFGDCKRRSGSKLSFLGMDFLIDNGSVLINIDLSKIIESTNCLADTPAPNHLFSVASGAESLTEANAEKFHSTVAKLLYVAKRTRPDILLTVNFLCTRVKAPTMEDAMKLVRLCRYLKCTMDDGILLKMERGDTLIMEAYIDASYGVHEDSKSHSGMMVTLGSGALLAISTKQKCVSKSSTEAELIAVTDLFPSAMEVVCNITEEITGKNVKLVLYQDNMATIGMIKNGTGGSRSKHIKIRFAWLKERLEDGDFFMEYKATGDMLADGLTKPKQGIGFESFKNGVGVQTVTKERAEESENLVVPDLCADSAVKADQE